MIKIIKAEYIAEKQIRLFFSDQSWGEYNFQLLIDRQAELVILLQDDSYFADFFLELGALCWKNGFELSAGSLHRKLQEQGLLHSQQQAA
jgi:hypothetical protein